MSGRRIVLSQRGALVFKYQMSQASSTLALKLKVGYVDAGKESADRECEGIG